MTRAGRAFLYLALLLPLSGSPHPATPLLVALAPLLILPVYGPILALQYLVERVVAKRKPEGRAPLAVRDACTLAVPAFLFLGWATLSWASRESLLNPAPPLTTLLVAYAHATHFVWKTGRGTRALGVGSIVVGVALVPLSVLTWMIVLEWPRDSYHVIIWVFLQAGCLALAGAALSLVWTGGRLLRVPLNEHGRWAQPERFPLHDPATGHAPQASPAPEQASVRAPAPPWPRSRRVTYAGATLLFVALGLPFLVYPGSGVALASIIGYINILIYGPILGLQALAERALKRPSPGSPAPLAVREARTLALPAFLFLAWAGVPWFLATLHVVFAIPLLLVVFAHVVHFVEKTGIGTRVLGLVSVAVGVALIPLSALALALVWSWDASEPLLKAGCTVACVAVAAAGAILVWTGLRLLRVPLDERGRWAPPESATAARSDADA